MKIICIKNGIFIKNISFNEYVFGIDENNKIINNFTFNNLNIDNEEEKEINDVIKNNQKIDIEKGYLFYTFAYQISYCHFMTQTLPKLTEWLNNYPNYKLLIPVCSYNLLCKDILDTLNIIQDKIIILEENIIYNIKDFIKGNTYCAPPDYYTSFHLNIYNKIRDKLNINNVKTFQNRLVYLKRDGEPNNKFGNSETGIKRQILNENNLIRELKKYNFEIINLGDKSLKDKMDLLTNINILITPLGANCINMIFSNGPNNIIILSNNTPFGENYYIDLVENLNNKKIQRFFKYYDVKFNNDTLNQWNGSFEVNIDEIITLINNLKTISNISNE